MAAISAPSPAIDHPPMKQTSLDPTFIPSATDLLSQMGITEGDVNLSDLRHAVARLPFNRAYDFLRAAVNSYISRDMAEQAIDYIMQFDTIASRLTDPDPDLHDIHAALLQILTALYIERDMLAEAYSTAGVALNLMVQSARRKDEAFLSTLASLLYDIALIHNARDEARQAERAIEKSMKLFERLARTNPARYAAAHMMALSASTGIYRSRVRQTRTLADCQAAVATYMRQINEGIAGAGQHLVEALSTQGRTLAKMNRHREAVQYFSRALKFKSKLTADFDIEQLELSIDLGEALLSVKGSRDKGVHLLNTMLYKANRLEADRLHRRIVDILLRAKDPSMGIFSFWHKLFPR